MSREHATKVHNMRLETDLRTHAQCSGQEDRVSPLLYSFVVIFARDLAAALVIARAALRSISECGRDHQRSWFSLWYIGI